MMMVNRTVRDGMPVLIRHDKFEWRNGDQVMQAVAGADITATGISGWAFLKVGQEGR